MARRRGKNQRLTAGGVALLVAGLVAVVLLRSWIWLLLVVALVGVGALARWGLRLHHELRRQDAIFRAEQRIRDANRTLETVDGLSGEEFEQVVATLLREGGCTGVRRVGGRGDRGRDVMGSLADGRSMVVQCKRFATNRSVVSSDMQRLLGARTNFTADVAIFVTNTRFTTDAQSYARDNDIITIGRNLFASWLAGARLEHVLGTGGGGEGDRRHLKIWKRAYGEPRRGSGRKPRK